MQKSIGIFVALFSILFSSAQAVEPQICERTHARVLSALQDPKNHLAFSNYGGMANGGVCWWHSRFIRNAAYLASFKPELPKPSSAEASAIAFQIRHFQVTEIPGYRNLKEFSADHASVIQRELEAWQRKDGLVRQAWFKGLRGNTAMNAESLNTHIQNIVEYFREENRPLYLKVQMPGIKSHAFLLIGVAAAPKGYDLMVIDSNWVGAVQTVQYRQGMTALSYAGERYIPYIDQEKDLSWIHGAYYYECGKELN